jgi:F-type H+-transporting ATPase subunit epsilon
MKSTIHLKLLLPTRILVDEDVSKVIAEAHNGSFCLLPRHVDFVAALTPGILQFTTEQRETRYYAIDRGTLVKCGKDVLLSTMNAVAGTDLGTLKRQVEEQFLTLDEQERMARTALARLEAGTLRRFTELEEYARERG